MPKKRYTAEEPVFGTFRSARSCRLFQRVYSRDAQKIAKEQGRLVRTVWPGTLPAVRSDPASMAPRKARKRGQRDQVSPAMTEAIAFFSRFGGDHVPLTI